MALNAIAAANPDTNTSNCCECCEPIQGISSALVTSEPKIAPSVLAA